MNENENQVTEETADNVDITVVYSEAEKPKATAGEIAVLATGGVLVGLGLWKTVELAVKGAKAVKNGITNIANGIKEAKNKNVIDAEVEEVIIEPVDETE